MTIFFKLFHKNAICLYLLLFLLIINTFLWQSLYYFGRPFQNHSTPYLPLSKDQIFFNINNNLSISGTLSTSPFYENAIYCVLIISFMIIFIILTCLFLIHEIQNAKNYTSSKYLYYRCYAAQLIFPISVIALLNLPIVLIGSLFIILLSKNTDPTDPILVISITVLIIININYQIIKNRNRIKTNEILNLIGIRITKKEMPILWQFIEKIAKNGNLRLPDNIIIGINHCFFVTESPISLWNGEIIQTGSTLYLPVTYMNYMSQSEVAAIISHELTHLSYDDTKYSHKFFVISQTLISTFHLLNMHKPTQEVSLWSLFYNTLTYPIFVFAEYFLDNYHQTIQHWKRSREIHADKVSANLSSKDELANALLRVALITPVIDYIVNEHWFDTQHQQTILDDIERLLIEEGFPDPLIQLQSMQNHPLDNHPTLQKRLQLINIKITDILIEKATDPKPSNLLIQLALTE